MAFPELIRTSLEAISRGESTKSEFSRLLESVRILPVKDLAQLASEYAPDDVRGALIRYALRSTTSEPTGIFAEVDDVRFVAVALECISLFGSYLPPRDAIMTFQALEAYLEADADARQFVLQRVASFVLSRPWLLGEIEHEQVGIVQRALQLVPADILSVFADSLRSLD